MFLVRIAQVVVISSLLMMGLWSIPKIDGLLFPVITNFIVNTNNDRPRNATEVYGTYTRLRDCRFIRTDQFFGVPGSRSVPIASIRLPSPANILVPGLGTYEWGPTRLYIPQSFVAKSAIYAVTIHDCYNGWLWDTETLVYKSNATISESASVNFNFGTQVPENEKY